MIDFSKLPDENSFRFVAILNKKIPIGNLLNALGHMTAGLAGVYSKSIDMCFLEYKDADKGVHPNISHFPFIVLKADNSNKIRALRNEAMRLKVPFTDFTNTMTIGTSKEQVEKTAFTKEQELEYYGICLFGEAEKLKSLTKRFSLFK